MNPTDFIASLAPAAFGKWTLTGVSAAAFGWLCIFLYSHGWKP